MGVAHVLIMGVAVRPAPASCKMLEYAVKWRLAMLIFLSAVVTKLLHSISGRVARWVRVDSNEKI